MNKMIVDSSLMELEDVIQSASTALLDQQREDGHWVFELEADATIPSEYILLVHYLGETANLELERKIGNYLRRIQAGHGGWPLFHNGAFDISATVKAYFALKMIGDPIDAPHMARAREAILAHGGAERANVFTRIMLALYGETSWKNVPTVPVELILVPRWFPIHLWKMSYWARTVMIPLLVLAALKPVARNPAQHPRRRTFPLATSAAHEARGASEPLLVLVFINLDRVLKLVDPYWPKKMRKKAIDRCVAFVTERLNGEDGLGAIYPAMTNSVMMFDALGYKPDHPDRVTARHSVEKLLVVKDGEAYCQPCVSPIWDTALACHALMEVRGEDANEKLVRGLEMAEDPPGAGREGRLGRGTARCAPRRLGLPVQQRPTIPIWTIPPWW